MTTKERILLESKAWRQEKMDLDTNYFVRLNELHDPKILWISSTDSLASVRDITNTDPGDIIIYGNLGSQVREDDVSMKAVVEQAIEIHNVTQIIICGYSHCTAIEAVLDGKAQAKGPMRNWLANLQALYEANYENMKGLPQATQQKVLSELNIREQVVNLSRFPSVQTAWEKRDYPEIFGWYFDLETGTLTEVFSLEKNHRLKQLSSLTDENNRIKFNAS
jgi:carbonic anhydrase